jgi:hypothetical protein
MDPISYINFFKPIQILLHNDIVSHIELYMNSCNFIEDKLSGLFTISRDPPFKNKFIEVGTSPDNLSGSIFKFLFIYL